jgi:hypothetical protein
MLIGALLKVNYFSKKIGTINNSYFFSSFQNLKRKIYTSSNSAEEKLFVFVPL